MSDEIIEEYRIPIRHERGKYTLDEVSVPQDYDGEVMTVKLESPGIVTNSMNEISLYDFKDDLRDVIEINYRHPMKYFGTEMPDNLESVFVKCSDGSKYPIYLEFIELALITLFYKGTIKKRELYGVLRFFLLTLYPKITFSRSTKE